MKVTELSRAQLIQLKQQYYDEQHPEGVSYGELAAVDSLITDEEIKAAYADTIFTDDDFTSQEPDL